MRWTRHKSQDFEVMRAISVGDDVRGRGWRWAQGPSQAFFRGVRDSCLGDHASEGEGRRIENGVATVGARDGVGEKLCRDSFEMGKS